MEHLLPNIEELSLQAIVANWQALFGLRRKKLHTLPFKSTATVDGRDFELHIWQAAYHPVMIKITCHYNNDNPHSCSVRIDTDNHTLTCWDGLQMCRADLEALVAVCIELSPCLVDVERYLREYLVERNRVLRFNAPYNRLEQTPEVLAWLDTPLPSDGALHWAARHVLYKLDPAMIGIDAAYADHEDCELFLQDFLATVLGRALDHLMDAYGLTMTQGLIYARMACMDVRTKAQSAVESIVPDSDTRIMGLEAFDALNDGIKEFWHALGASR